MTKINDQIKFNIFSFISTFSRSLIEIFISLYLFKNGFTVTQVILFYFLVNIFAVPLSYWFVKLGEKTKYSYVMIIGLIAFIGVQLLLREVNHSNNYLIIIAIIYSIYRRGYWVSRRFYITNIMPTKKSSGVMGIVMIMSQLASILAGYLGATILANLNMNILALISSALLFISIIPLGCIKYEKTNNKICLIENIKKYNKSNFVAFSMYELNNILSFIFPLYIALYVENSYEIAGNLNAISNIAIILCVIGYAKIINKNRNYVIVCTILVLLCTVLKLYISSSIIVLVYFIEGIVSKLQNQSINKIYFENRGGMDLIHYNLIYQMAECFVRAMVAVPLLFMRDVRIMIIFVIVVIIFFLLLYCLNRKKDEVHRSDN